MENIHFKNLIYFVVAIIWFLVSLYANKQTKKKIEAKPKKKTKPTLFDEISEEIKKNIEAEKKAKSIPPQKQRNTELQNTQQIPEEVLMAEKRKMEREKTLKNEIDRKQSATQNQRELAESAYFQHEDLQKMVIFTEIFKRPNF